MHESNSTLPWQIGSNIQISKQRRAQLLQQKIYRFCTRYLRKRAQRWQPVPLITNIRHSDGEHQCNTCQAYASAKYQKGCLSLTRDNCSFKPDSTEHKRMSMIFQCKNSRSLNNNRCKKVIAIITCEYYIRYGLASIRDRKILSS